LVLFFKKELLDFFDFLMRHEDCIDGTGFLPPAAAS